MGQIVGGHGPLGGQIVRLLYVASFGADVAGTGQVDRLGPGVAEEERQATLQPLLGLELESVIVGGAVVVVCAEHEHIRIRHALRRPRVARTQNGGVVREAAALERSS